MLEFLTWFAVLCGTFTGGVLVGTWIIRQSATRHAAGMVRFEARCVRERIARLNEEDAHYGRISTQEAMDIASDLEATADFLEHDGGPAS